MKKGLEKNTGFLEQCRSELEMLSPMGEGVLAVAIKKAEEQALICERELREAQKTVSITANQEKAVMEACVAGEDKLAQAIVEEEDARLAVETVQRMIDDSSSLMSVGNKDTAKILFKAETVLKETVERAKAFHADKSIQREEINNAIQRLHATQMAVQYSMAKAKRAESEKTLASITAAHRMELSEAEIEVLNIDNKQGNLQSQKDAEESQLLTLKNELSVARQTVRDTIFEVETVQASVEADCGACHRDANEREEAVAAEIAERERQKEEAIKTFNNLSALAEEKAEASLTVAAALKEARAASEEAVLRTEERQRAAEQEMDLEVNQLRQNASRHNDAYTSSVARLNDMLAKSARLNQSVEECVKRVVEAAEEEKAARDAAETAFRLAENAVKVRESISSESAQLLLHAQNVLMEATAAAQHLMEEKNILRKSAEQEFQLKREEAEELDRAVQEVRKQCDAEKADWEQAELVLRDRLETVKTQKNAWAAETAKVIDDCANAVREIEEKAIAFDAASTQAAAELAEAKMELQAIDESLLVLKARQVAIGEDLADRLNAINERAAALLSASNATREQAEMEVASLEKEYQYRLNAVKRIQDELHETFVKLREARAKVDDIILAGAIAITNAEDEVETRQQEENSARIIAEEAVVRIGDEGQLRTIRLFAENKTLTVLDENEIAKAVAAEAMPLSMETPAAAAGQEWGAEPSVALAEEAEAWPGIAVAMDEALIPEDEPTTEETLIPEEAEIAEEELITGDALFADETPVPEESLFEESLFIEEALIPEEEIIEAQPEEIAAADEQAQAGGGGRIVPFPDQKAEAQAPDEDKDPAVKDISGEPTAADAGEGLIVDYNSMTEEEIEYTHRLELLSQGIMEKALQAEADKASGNPDWIANLKQEQEQEPTAKPDAAALDAEDQAVAAPAAAPIFLYEAQPNQKTTDDEAEGTHKAAAQSKGAASDTQTDDEENELLLSILSSVDEQAPKEKKRRFPFF